MILIKLSWFIAKNAFLFSRRVLVAGGGALHSWNGEFPRKPLFLLAKGT